MFLFMKTESMDSYMATQTLTKRVFKLIQNNTGKRTEIRKVPKRTPSDNEVKYRVIRKSLRDFRSLRYSSWDGHAGREHVNRGRDTPSFCPTLQMLVMSTLGQASQKFLAHARWPRPAFSFRSAQAATLLLFHVPLTNCFVRRWFCVVHGPKPPLHRHNWLSFVKFQDTERILIHCPRHVSSRLPPSGETCKYAMTSITQTWTDSLPVDMLLSAVSDLVVAQTSSEFLEGRMNYLVQKKKTEIIVACYMMCSPLDRNHHFR